MTESANIPTRKMLAWMFSFLSPVRTQTVLACVFLTLGIGVEILVVRQTRNTINEIQALHFERLPSGGWIDWLSTPATLGLRSAIGWLTGLSLALAVLSYFREVSGKKLTMEMVYYFRSAVYDKLQRIGMGFHDTVSTGELINRALTDLQNVREFVYTAVLSTLEIVLIVGGYIILLLASSPWVALWALVPLPIWLWYIARFSRKLRPAQEAVMEAADRNVSLITENIAGVHVVKAFAAENQEIRKYDANLAGYFARTMTRIRLYANFNPVIRGIASASHLSLFLVAGILIINHKMSVGDLLMLGAAMGAILGRLQQVSAINDQYQNAIVSARRVWDVLHSPPTVVDKPGAQPLPVGPGVVRFENVTFGYDPARPILRDVSFEIPGGSMIALVGPTGAGKTTLVSLIARFYDPQHGRIEIDGVDIREISLDSLRTSVAFVFQETYLFSDTVEANISYSRPRVAQIALPDERETTGEIEAASRLAQAHEFVAELPRGYETMLGERGATLSGGQRQRLAIARAILANPRILILDDATAAIDPETEQLIHRGMRAVLHGRTSFVIAHRISTARKADLVIVLEHGQVTQIGRHDDLMQRDGHYRDIAAVQLFGDDLARDESGDELSHLRRVAQQQPA